MKTSLQIVFFLLTTSLVWSQGQIKGIVRDTQGNPITGAVLTLDENNYYDTSDQEGKFQFYNVPNSAHTVKVNYLGYKELVQVVKVTSNQTLFLELTFDDSYKLEEVIINSNIDAQASAYNTQKNKNNISQIVSGEQVEKYPDANIGDAIKRLPGINVQYDQGEARFANIRGIAPEYNSITLNGDRIPSAEAEKRYVQLDLIPSDMIEKIEVNKAVTPDMDADAIGGSINLETQKAGAKESFSGTIGSGYSLLTEKPIYKGNITYTNRFEEGKVGLVIEASVLDKQTRSDDVEPLWDYTDENNKDASAFTNELQIRQYFVERLRKSFSATLDFAINPNHNIYLSGMYNHRNDWENRYRLEFKDIEMDGLDYTAEVVRQVKGGSSDNKNARLEDQKMVAFKTGGEHLFNKVKADWNLSVMQASEMRPNERYIKFRKKNVEVTLDHSNIEEPQVKIIDPTLVDFSDEYGFKELTEQQQDVKEKDFNGKLNVELPLLTGANSSFLKLGTRFKIKNKYRDLSFHEYEPTAAYESTFEENAYASTRNQTFSNYQAGNYQVGSFVTNEFLGNLDLQNSQQFEESDEIAEEIAGEFEAKENVYAGYLMYTQNVGKILTLVGGVRMEHTELTYSGYEYDGDETLTFSGIQSDSYQNILPGLHVKVTPVDNLNLRVAFTNTIARPNYYDVVPYTNIDTGDNILSKGNPSLLPTQSMNFDVMGEYFFKNIGVLSLGGYYKKLDNVIAIENTRNYNYAGHVYTIFQQPRNIGNGNLFGIEVGLHRRLDFLPGVLNKLNITANYTINQSKLKDVNITGREAEELPISGTPKNLINASLGYDSKKIEMRISYSSADAFIEEFGNEAFYDRWYDKVQYLDFNTSYKFHKNWKFYVSLENLLNQPLRYYQGIESRTQQAEYYGVQAKAGVKFKF